MGSSFYAPNTSHIMRNRLLLYISKINFIYGRKNMKHVAIEQAYNELAEAIVAQAGIDYLKTRKKLETVDPESKKGKILTKEFEDVKKFFRSRWYKDLTDIDPEWLVKKLDEAYNGMKNSNNLKLIDELKVRGV